MNIYSQDTLFFNEGSILNVKVQSIDDGMIKYRRLDNIDGPVYSSKISDINKVKYYDGSNKVYGENLNLDTNTWVVKKDIVVREVDTIFSKRLFFKFNFTNLFVLKPSLAFEQQISKNYLLEFQVDYRIYSPGGAGSANWSRDFIFFHEGFETRVAINRYLFRFKKSAFTLGAGLSYRYSHASNQIYIVSYNSKVNDRGVYRMSQTRNYAGLHLKLAYQLRYKRTGFEFFIQPGIYVGDVKNTYFEHKGTMTANTEWQSTGISPIQTSYMKDGFSVLPNFNCGVALRLKFLNEKERMNRKLNRIIDTSFKIRDAIKLNISSLLACKISMTYERVFKSKYSWEIEPSFIFPNPIYDVVTQFFWPNVWFKNQGFELRTGINILYGKTRRRRKTVDSHGLFLSYRYTHNDNVYYWTGGISGSSYHSLYKISQTKNLLGLIYKRSFFNGIKKTSFVPFYEFGFYYGFSRTVCFYDSGGYSRNRRYPMSVYNVGLPFENGYVFIPVARVGFNIRCGIGNNK